MITIASGCSRLISRSTSRPEPSGRSISSRTAAGRSASKFFNPSATEAASTAANPQLCRDSVSVQRIAWSSSTTSICSFVFFRDINESEGCGFDYMAQALPLETNPMEHDHSPEAIRKRLETGPTHNYLRDWIYGGIDGSVTTLAVVTGVAGAQLSKWIILALGFANLFADGFSMAASNYLGTRAEHDDWRRLEQIENRHIELAPEG